MWCHNTSLYSYYKHHMTQVGMWPSWLWGSWPLFPFGHSPTVVSSLSILHSGTSMASRCAGCNHKLVKARTNVLTFKYSFERSNVWRWVMFTCTHWHVAMWSQDADKMWRFSFACLPNVRHRLVLKHHMKDFPIGSAPTLCSLLPCGNIMLTKARSTW